MDGRGRILTNSATGSVRCAIWDKTSFATPKTEWSLLDLLLQGIVDNPHDVDRWLILSDWLEEYDPNRAELLRLHRRLLATCCEPDEHPERVEWHSRVITLLDEGVRPCVPQRKLVLDSGVEMTFSFIPPGSFLMGSPPDEKGRRADEVQRRVSLAGALWMGVYPVTQAQWQAVMGDNPSEFKGEDRPVESVPRELHVGSLAGYGGFCERLSERLGQLFRLPTEAEWEWACRAGTTTAYFTGDDEKGMRRVGWCNHDRQHWRDWWVGTRPVGQSLPNAFGLFDMHGNVEEQTADRTERGYPVLRGGSWHCTPDGCRSADRQPWLENIIRCVIGCRVCVDAGWTFPTAAPSRRLSGRPGRRAGRHDGRGRLPGRKEGEKRTQLRLCVARRRRGRTRPRAEFVAGVRSDYTHS